MSNVEFHKFRMDVVARLAIDRAELRGWSHAIDKMGLNSVEHWG